MPVRWLSRFARIPLPAAVLRYARDRRGSVAVTMALSLLTLALAVGMSIDVGRYILMKTRLQQIADAAGLAANAYDGGRTNDTLREIAEKAIAANKMSGNFATVSIVSSVYDEATGRYNLTLRGDMKTTLMRVGGIDTMAATASTSTYRVAVPIEIALVVDNTTSMNTVVEAGKSKIELVKDALNDLIDSLANSSYVKVGIVPFTLTVKVGTQYTDAIWMDASTKKTTQSWGGCPGFRTANRYTLDKTPGVISIPPRSPEENEGYPYNYWNCGGTQMREILPLTDAKRFKQTILDAVSGSLGESASFVPIGLIWGWNVLTAEAPYVQGRTKEEVAETGGRKVLILLSDGGNNTGPIVQEKVDEDPSLKGTAWSAPFGYASEGDAMQKKLCENIQADGIDVFTVLYMGPFDLNYASNVTLFKNCASRTSWAFVANDAAKLKKAFRDIGEGIVGLRLTN